MIVQLLQAGARSLLGLCLTAEHLLAFQTYYEELAAWNERFNLTTIIGQRDVQIKHFLDSLTCLLALPADTAAFDGALPDTVPISTELRALSCVDVGTGAGFPGVPLKIVRPEIRLTLVESTAKKATFLRHVVERLALSDVEIVNARAEDLGHEPRYREQYDLVLARAVARLPTLAEYCLPLCKVGGRFVAQKGSEARAELEDAGRAIELLGGRLQDVKEIHIAEIAQHRYLISVGKVRSTPSQYPRRSGIPSKRPLLQAHGQDAAN